jgi:hypothetical protein
MGLTEQVKQKGLDKDGGTDLTPRVRNLKSKKLKVKSQKNSRLTIDDSRLTLARRSFSVGGTHDSRLTSHD